MKLILSKRNRLDDVDSNLIIEESVRILEREKQRKDSIEIKASTLLNTVTLVITILVSVIGFILSTSAVKNPLFFIFYVVGIIFLTISMMLLILTLRTKGYMDPFETEDIDKIRYIFKNDSNTFKKRIIQEYTNVLSLLLLTIITRLNF